ncbi:MAG: NAD-dependent malic enzyme [Polyangiaceae bacterium]
MTKLKFERTPQGKLQVQVHERGRALLCNSLLNKGTAFTDAERDTLGLRGLLPQNPTPMEVQAARAYGNICRKSDPLERYIGMAALQDRNETLFYRVLGEHVEELMPIVYTPTVGEACKFFSQIFRRGRGIWITPEDSGRIARVLENAGTDDVRLIVVTDNERILGLGDQGAGGMGIPIGKLSLYTLGAGIHPSQTLPISLDVGTDNQELLNNELYVGWRHPRLRGQRYYDLVEEFVDAVMTRFPKALLQWEDFKKANAFTLLGKYRKRLCSFNDDIQGTAAVALAGIFAVVRKRGVDLARQRVVILGAGAAGVGIGHQVRDALQRAGLTGADLTRAVAVLDSRGLIVNSRDFRDEYKREFAWPEQMVRELGLDPEQPIDLYQVVKALQPSVLIGTSGQPGVFTEEIVREMAAHCDAPAIFPFSNPTSKSEATPEQLLEWTDGRALVATGSPFDPVELPDGRRVRIGQGNNVYVFPGVGLGALVSEASEVTDSMFTVAAHTLASELTDQDLAEGSLFPRMQRLREITRKIACAVVKEAADENVGKAFEANAIYDAVSEAMWEPEYPELIPV